MADENLLSAVDEVSLGSVEEPSTDSLSGDPGTVARQPTGCLTDTGSPDNGSADDGSADDGSADNRSADIRSADNSLADNRSADNGSPDDGSADNRSADIRSADNSLADNRSADDGSADNGSADDGSADNRSAYIRSADNSLADNRSADDGSADNGSSDNKSTDNGSPDNGSPDYRPADNGSPDNGSANNRTADNRSPDNRSPDNKLPDNGSLDNRSPDNVPPNDLSADTEPSMDEPPVNKSVSESRDTSSADIRLPTDESVTLGESVDGSVGGSADYDSTVESSPILFRALDETDDDAVTDTETVDSARPTFGAFGASLATQKQENGHYCHRLHQVEEGVCNKLRCGDELRYINKTDVSSWNHHEVLESIRLLRERVTFTFCRKCEVFEKGNMMRTEDTFVEITFIVTDQDSDGKALSFDKAFAHIIDVTYKFSKMIRYNSSLAVMRYLGKTCVKVAHGVETHHFLRALGNRAVMEQQRGQQECYKFWMYSYAVKDSKDDKGKSVVAFQSVRCQLFLMCNMISKKLSLVQKNIDSNLRIMKSNSPCLFLLSSNGSNDSFLESVAYDGLFLGYDAVDELELNRLRPGDRASGRVRASSSFHITPTTP
ncbi:serine-rich adhesin for platelets-like [Haliotis cracherodii]|uniref:serine-rich adhesin for platelets-like n=1 Tax=Haliotis cracherodii TaxID=6455 RepID=UPI0039EB5F3E